MGEARQCSRRRRTAFHFVFSPHPEFLPTGQPGGYLAAILNQHDDCGRHDAGGDDARDRPFGRFGGGSQQHDCGEFPDE